VTHAGEMARGFERAGHEVAVYACDGYAYERGRGPEKSVAGYLTVGSARRSDIVHARATLLSRDLRHSQVKPYICRTGRGTKQLIALYGQLHEIR
jgi:hypothetical protein